MERQSIKSISFKIGAILLLVGVILTSVALIYHKKIFCKMLDTKTFYETETQIIYLFDEENNKEFALSWSANKDNKKPITLIKNFWTYYYVDHYCFIQDNYYLIME